MIKAFAPAADRNKDPILCVLREVLPASGRLLELASGTGQHAVHFAAAFPGLAWQPTDGDPAAMENIEAYRAAAALPNLLPPRVLDVALGWDLPVDPWDAIVCINLVHISPWEVTLSLFKEASSRLVPGGVLYLYGAYLVEGVETAPSNLAFDESLRERNPRWGLRRLEAVTQEAAQRGLTRERVVAMPANNLSVIFRKPR